MRRPRPLKRSLGVPAESQGQLSSTVGGVNKDTSRQFLSTALSPPSLQGLLAEPPYNVNISTLLCSLGIPDSQKLSA